MTTRRSPRALGLASVLAFGCALTDKNLGEVGDTSGEDSSGASEPGTDDGVSGQADGTAGSETGETDGDPTECVGADVNFPECHEDVDGDNVRLLCDNLPGHFNPSQSDMDGDGIGDEADLCPTVPSSNNMADADGDGVGDDCDTCRRTSEQYNNAMAGVPIPTHFKSRNIPDQSDFDRDGIGDACDNCVAFANCENFGPDNPHVPGDPIADDDTNVCQRDEEQFGVGDDCAGLMLEGAAGPVGMGGDDDFDQDGLRNSVDACLRQPVPEAITCSGPEDCPDGSRCDDDRCDHVDSDDDGVGDVCDTCPLSANPLQTMHDTQDDDQDGDFVGDVCETLEDCTVIANPPPTAYYEHSALGRCCTVQLVEGEDGELLQVATGQPLVDPDGLPVRLDCEVDSGSCRLLPPSVAAMPGMLVVPPGCDAVLGDVNPLDNVDMRGEVPLEELAAYACTMPQWDQDHDGVGDGCDVCPFAFDPSNAWHFRPDGVFVGDYCSGEYSPDALCEGSD